MEILDELLEDYGFVSGLDGYEEFCEEFCEEYNTKMDQHNMGLYKFEFEFAKQLHDSLVDAGKGELFTGYMVAPVAVKSGKSLTAYTRQADNFEQVVDTFITVNKPFALYGIMQQHAMPIIDSSTQQPTGEMSAERLIIRYATVE